MQLERCLIAIPVGIFLSKQIMAKDLGVAGPLFEIKEQSLLEVIFARLNHLHSSNKLGSYQKKLQLRAQLSIERPQPVTRIHASKKYHVRAFNPSFVLDRDIKDLKGKFIGKKGTIYNPLDYHSFGKPLLFINGDDAAQVSWALAEEGKIILIQGTPINLTKQHKRTFYFDQGGVLSKKFNISAVPTRISQKEKLLHIEEINLS